MPHVAVSRQRVALSSVAVDDGRSMAWLLDLRLQNVDMLEQRPTAVKRLGPVSVTLRSRHSRNYQPSRYTYVSLEKDGEKMHAECAAFFRPVRCSLWSSVCSSGPERCTSSRCPFFALSPQRCQYHRYQSPAASTRAQRASSSAAVWATDGTFPSMRRKVWVGVTDTDLPIRKPPPSVLCRPLD